MYEMSTPYLHHIKSAWCYPQTIHRVLENLKIPINEVKELMKHVHRTATKYSTFSTNDCYWSVMVTGSQSHV